jgi:hypothetical protein
MKDDNIWLIKANKQLVTELIGAAKHAELFIDLRDFIAAMSDKKSRTPYSAEVALGLLKRLDDFMEPNYTENVTHLKRFLQGIGDFELSRIT